MTDPNEMGVQCCNTERPCQKPKSGYAQSRDHQTARQTLIDCGTMTTVKFKNRLVNPNPRRTHPEIAEFAQRFLKAAHKANIPLYPHCYVRTLAEQQRLFDLGRSRARPGFSPHNFGLAVDLVHGSRHWDLTQHEWDILGAMGHEVARKMGVGITWGGDWRFYDPAHWELRDWKDLKGWITL